MDFIDLRPSHNLIKKDIINKIKKIFNHKKFILGPEVLELEQKLTDYVNSKAICVGSGTDALLLALMAIGIKPGDEVITTPMTFCSTVNVILHVGAKPVLCDIDKLSKNINPEKI